MECKYALLNANGKCSFDMLGNELHQVFLGFYYANFPR